MIGEIVAVKMMREGGVLIRPLVVGTTEFMIEGVGKVKRFPLALLKYLKSKEIVEIKHVASFHSVYKLVKRKKGD